MAIVYFWGMRVQAETSSVGHLSMSLDDGTGNGTYISHWPMEDFKDKFASLKKGMARPTLEDDNVKMKRGPDKTVYLPAEMIDVKKIILWWKSIMKKGPKYQLLFSNCGQMVESALIQGGINQYRTLTEVIARTMDIPRVMPLQVLTWIKLCLAEFEHPVKTLVAKTLIRSTLPLIPIPRLFSLRKTYDAMRCVFEP